MLDLPSTSISRRPAAAGAFLLLVALVMTEGGSLGQDGFDPPTRRVVVPEGVELEGRAHLLREGGILQKARGTIERSEDLGVYVFRPKATTEASVSRELILLPSRGLEDLVRVEKVMGRVGSSTAANADFEVSGRVLVYRGRNFLLPEAVVPMFGLDGSTSASEPSSKVEVEDDDDDAGLADRIERRLEERIGAVPRSLDLQNADAVSSTPIDSGTRFIDRRGRITRDPASGVWRFVLAGDGLGADVPSVVLLPCLELERLERRVRETDVRDEVLLSGRISNFQGRVYLLPTVVRVARQGRGIGP